MRQEESGRVRKRGRKTAGSSGKPGKVAETGSSAFDYAGSDGLNAGFSRCRGSNPGSREQFLYITTEQSGDPL